MEIKFYDADEYGREIDVWDDMTSIPRMGDEVQMPSGAIKFVKRVVWTRRGEIHINVSEYSWTGVKS